MTIYRSMKPAQDGLPQTGPTARTLGSRPGTDIPSAGGLVRPGTGGMSVSPDDPMNLPKHRRPPQLDGTGKDPVYRMNTADLPPGLRYRPDPAKPREHGFIEPAHEMPDPSYQGLLESTKAPAGSGNSRNSRIE